MESHGNLVNSILTIPGISILAAVYCQQKTSGTPEKVCQYTSGKEVIIYAPMWGDGSIVDFAQMFSYTKYNWEWINAGNGEAIYNNTMALGEKKGGLRLKPGSIYTIIKSAPDEGKLFFMVE